MGISGARRKVISRIFVSFSGIIFGLLIISPFTSGKEIDPFSIVMGVIILIVMMIVSVVSEPGVIATGVEQ
jgi:hypothetical protein